MLRRTGGQTCYGMDVLNGMKNYAMMREAGCSRSQRANVYCFANALAATPPSNIYFINYPSVRIYLVQRSRLP